MAKKQQPKPKPPRQLVGVYLEVADIHRIDGWAERFQCSRSRMVAMLAEACIENEAWMIGIASHPVCVAVARGLGVGRAKEQETSGGVVPAAG